MPQATTAVEIFRLQPFRGPLKQKLFSPIGRTAEHLLALDRCRRIYAGLSASRPEAFCAEVLDVLGVRVGVTSEDLARIPKSGPLVVVANHPFGAVEGLILLHLLHKVRPDVRVMANFLLGVFPEFHEKLIAVDPFERPGAVRANVRPLRESLRWLQQGGVLVIFPAGAVSHLKLSKRAVVDPPWTADLSRIVRRAGAPVLPVYFRGGNGPLFQLAGLIDPRLRTAFLPHELLNKKDKMVEVRIGAAVPHRKLQKMRDDEMTGYLRTRTYLLAERRCAVKKVFGVPAPVLEPLRPAVSPALLEEEIARLPARQLLLESGPFRVLQAEAEQIPHLLQEIGRLRELTFRGVGEGTGRSVDLDRFDALYTHLFVWNAETREVVGAYRLGRTDRLLLEGGLEGIYTRTLFKYRRKFLDRIGPAIELGRSFVRPEYQKSYAPLLLLWKGIGHFVAQNPRYATLFGPVSISREYGCGSRALIAASLIESCTIPELARLVKGRRPVPLKGVRMAGCDSRATRALLSDFEEVASVIADLEPDGKGVPVLLRQYLNLGGKILAFNVDPDFSDVLDGLVLVDLRRTEPKTLERYLGRDGACTFLAHHYREESGDQRRSG